jgi:hypothetical protein
MPHLYIIYLLYQIQNRFTILFDKQFVIPAAYLKFSVYIYHSNNYYRLNFKNNVKL